jgi:hypothetical protein
MLNCGAQSCSPCIFIFVRMRELWGSMCPKCPHAQKGQLMMIHKSTALLVRSAAFLPRRWRPRGPGTCAAV